MLIPRSSVAGIEWPALPAPPGAAMLALQYQLEQSQWWPPEILLEQQQRQLSQTLVHACATIPFYRERFLACGLDPQSALWPDDFPKLPLLTRAEVQGAAGALLSAKPPPEHGRVSEGQTSGSTGRPIRFFSTGVTQSFWHAFTLREHLWHARDFSGKLAAIRKVSKAGERSGWGPSTDVVFDTGPSVGLKIETDTDRPVLINRRRKGSIVLLDDADRDDERVAISRWRQEPPDFEITWWCHWKRLPLASARCHGLLSRTDN